MELVAEHQHVYHEKAAIGFYAQGGQNMADLVRLVRYQTGHVAKYKWHVNHVGHCVQLATDSAYTESYYWSLCSALLDLVDS